MVHTRSGALKRAAQIRRVLVSLLLANLVVVGAKFIVGLGTGSLAVLGDAVHSSVDAMNNVLALFVMWIAARAPDEDHPYGHQKFETLGAGVLSGVLLARGGVAWADPIVALSVALVIAVLAYGIVARSIPVLVDRHIVPSSVIQTSAEAVEGVMSAYDIRSRGSRDVAFAELTISVDRRASVETAHRIADAVETRLRTHHRLHQIIVHIEPC